MIKLVNEITKLGFAIRKKQKASARLVYSTVKLMDEIMKHKKETPIELRFTGFQD